MRTSRFNEAPIDLASALSALEPIAPMDWVTPSFLHSVANALEV